MSDKRGDGHRGWDVAPRRPSTSGTSSSLPADECTNDDHGETAHRRLDVTVGRLEAHHFQADNDEDSDSLGEEIDRDLEDASWKISNRISEEISRALDEQLQAELDKELDKAEEERRRELDRQLDEQFERYMAEKLTLGDDDEYDHDYGDEYEGGGDFDLGSLHDVGPASVESINVQIQRIIDQHKAGKKSDKIYLYTT